MAVGTRLPQRLGQYTLLKKLGLGGMAEVFLARHEPSKAQVVVKRMLAHLAEEPKYVTMFEREAALGAALSHPNIVRVYENGVVDDTHYIAMEYVDGVPLHTLARTAWKNGRTLPLEVACCAVHDAASALSAMHEKLQVVHRDISPDNLIIDRTGVTKILDFGVAKVSGSVKTSTGEVKGKVPFAAPEQILGKKLDGRLDIYSLGVTFYWLATAKLPFHEFDDIRLMEAILEKEAPRPRSYNRALPVFLDELILKMMDKDPARRPQSGAEVTAILAKIADASRAIVVAPCVVATLQGELAPDDEKWVLKTDLVAARFATAAFAKERPAWLPWALGAAAVVVASLVGVAIVMALTAR